LLLSLPNACEAKYIARANAKRSNPIKAI
jgi:hypothetical protein